MKEANLVIGLVFAMEGLASLYVKQGEFQHAVLLFAWSDATRDRMGDTRPPVEQASIEQDWATARLDMGDLEFTSLLAEGKRMTLEEIVSLALHE